MPTATETPTGRPNLAVSREPVPLADQNGELKTRSAGAQALNDALVIVIIAWVVLFLLIFSLRSYNV